MYLSSDRVVQLVENREIKINPFINSNLLDESYEIRLGNMFKSVEHIDDDQCRGGCSGFKTYNDAYILNPKSFVLAQTTEKIGLSSELIAFIKSRENLFDSHYAVHTVDGFISNKKPEVITLNIFNSSKKPISLYPGMKIGEVVFARRNR